MRTRTTTAVAAISMATITLMPTASLASSARMPLTCDSGSLAGHTIERSNGSSWWDIEDGSVLTTTSLTVRDADDQTVYEKQYGAKAGQRETCSGDHGEFTWDVELVRAGSR